MKNYLDTQSYLITKVLCVLLKLRLCQPFWDKSLFSGPCGSARNDPLGWSLSVIYIRGVSSLTPISIDSSKQIGNLNVRHHDEVSAAKAKCPPSGTWPPSQRNCKWSHTPFAVFKACQGCCLSEWHSENFLEASRGRRMMKVCFHAGSIKAQLIIGDLILLGTGIVSPKLCTVLII